MSEPTNAELQRVYERLAADMQRGFAEIRSDLRDQTAAINGRLDRMATKEDVRDDMAAVHAAIAEEKALRVSGDKEEERARREAIKDLRAQLDKFGNNLRWIAVSLLLPIGLFVANLVASRK